jgi:type I restriction enzyme R subunit
MLKGDAELDSQVEDQSLFDVTPVPEKLVEISYNRQIPIETFDFVIADECHRSIYNLWR